MNPRARRMAKLAGDRILNSGPEACERMEWQALAALKKAEWDWARRLLRLRLIMRHRPAHVVDQLRPRVHQRLAHPADET